MSHLSAGMQKQASPSSTSIPRLSRTFRVSEEFRIQAMLEAFNLFNHVNGVALNGNFWVGGVSCQPNPDV
jgi:hypothetical protein